MQLREPERGREDISECLVQAITCQLVRTDLFFDPSLLLHYIFCPVNQQSIIFVVLAICIYLQSIFIGEKSVPRCRLHDSLCFLRLPRSFALDRDSSGEIHTAGNHLIVLMSQNGMNMPSSADCHSEIQYELYAFRMTPPRRCHLRADLALHLVAGDTSIVKITIVPVPVGILFC